MHDPWAKTINHPQNKIHPMQRLAKGMVTRYPGRSRDGIGRPLSAQGGTWLT